MKLHREKTLNGKSNEAVYGPTVDEMRMSRLSHPRGTLFAMVLLAAVFLIFGLFVGAAEPAPMPAPNTIDGAAQLIGNWVLGCTPVTG